MSERSLKQVGSVGFLVLAGKAARFCVLIAMARLLTPEDFGVFAIFALALNVCYTFYKNIVTNILVQRKDMSVADINTVAFTSLVFSVFASLFFVSMAKPLAAFFGNTELAYLFYLTPIFLLIHGFGSVAIGLLSRAHRVVDVERSQTLYSTLVNLAVSLFLAVLGFDFMALVIGLLVGELICAIRLYCILQQKFAVRYHKESFYKIKSALKSYYYISLVSNFNQFIDQILIGKFLGLAAVGIYTRAVQLREYPLFIFSKTVVRILFPVLADIQDKPARVRVAMLKTLNLTLLLLLPITVFLYLESEAIVLVVLGDQWHKVVGVMSILMLGVPFMVCSGIFHAALKAANRESAIARYLTVYSVMLIISLSIGVQYEAHGIAIAVTFTAAMHCVNYAVLYARTMSISFFDYLGVSRAGSLLAFIVAMILLGMELILADTPAILKLFIVSAVFSSTAVALLLLLPKSIISSDGLWLRRRLLEHIRLIIGRRFPAIKV
ncbi:MAG: oligosaccharide flippase family protein [Cellvibrionaceae bacterium]|nr:oligosaccharide flippase family protein [Cellvibrionaceae bacterium]